MSDQRTNTDEPVDPRVSAAYREMADEHTPEHLDHIVLNAARSAARPRWNTAISWLRPAAWVATIGVCLAIVVEISLMEDEGTAKLDSPAPTVAPPAAISPVTAPAAGTQRFEKTVPAAAEPATAQSVQDPAPRPSADPESRSDAAEVTKRARELRQQENLMEDTAPNRLLHMAPATNALDEAVTERYCDETQTAEASSWLACILELERQGLLEAARLERGRLAEAFPPPMIP
jgi:DNA-directed RNA polymerase subunit K/omega